MKTLYHSVERTSPKGQNFVGTCQLCGKEGLTFENMEEPCENPRGLNQDEALLEAINPERKDSNDLE